ncbi:MBL fold metallo-hydrolase [Dyadobacter sediminis]|uniref:3',5'-cyclic-nucleotide phosphodiesterase n=1 Tax=Dyadobacter sediminis TaxID=1493691 RepID=A0A5R9K473_9BACT|nr:3',5'-cyclic-nucleotide phosphodiesterase [Dyadobacter sediminis]TLU88832.1 3',5'-cyclic-nucleotide phosphodiesterase [Dyadobacter sediminis]GGC13543.1 3',5'-cyclic-nucleotide phosphodiesterase [Dyadobacter sediminis]
MIRSGAVILWLFVLSVSASFAQNGFKVVPLGVKGGVEDGNLSAYMLAPLQSDGYVCLDAGTIHAGIQKAVFSGAFKVSAEEVLKKYIRAYFISHPHLDHISGMIINSVEDTAKNIYGFPDCIRTINDHYFNWKSWPNMGNEGNSPALKKYTYKILEPGIETKVEQTQMTVKALKLSHSKPGESAAFLLENTGNYVLYFGDTGPDEIEKTDYLQQIWKVAAPLIRSGKLKGIFLEVSYANEQPDEKLFGHLTPRWFMKEMNKLAELAGKDKMHKLNVVVTHIKPTGNSEEQIKKQLASENKLGLNLIFPEQGVGFEIK